MTTKNENRKTPNDLTARQSCNKEAQNNHKITTYNTKVMQNRSRMIIKRFKMNTNTQKTTNI